MKRPLSVFDKHQIRIAKQTLLLTDVGASVLGGPTKVEAREILRRFGYGDRAIASLERLAK